MKTADFHFDLPESLIAQMPLAERTESRLLHVDRARSALADKQFTDLIDLVNQEDLLIFNNTRVMRARLFGQKATGGQVELLIERILSNQECLAHMRVAKKPKPGQYIYMNEKPAFEMLGRSDDLFHLKFLSEDPNTQIFDFLEQFGHIPLPPYIDREDTAFDDERYQTVYAKDYGAVAAPTAGLHFDDAFLNRLDAKGVQRAEITLHVGAGTFQPVKVDDVESHHMHSEVIEVNQSVVDAINACRARGGRVIAIGTTVVRALESAATATGEISAYTGDTSIFIYPGYSYKIVDALFTNFHLPESTLLMLVSAFASKSLIMEAYQHAVSQAYRFFSYGDAMFIS